MGNHENERDEEILEKPIEEVMDYIIDEYGEEIKRLIFTYVKTHSITDDIFQEFLIKVYRSIDDFKKKSKLKTWLYRIAINKCKDYLRSPIHRILGMNEVFSPKQEKSAEDAVIRKEQNVQLANAVLSLPVKYREIMILRYYQSFSIQQISQLLHINESTVKTRLLRGKSKLRQKLGGDSYGYETIKK